MSDERHKNRKQDPVLRKIDAVRRSVAYWTLGWGYLWVALLVVAAVFAGVLLDHAVVLQRWGRVAFFRTFLALLGAGVVGPALFPFFMRVRRLYVARRMEKEKPELGNALVTYLQCRDDRTVPADLKRLMRRKVEGPIRSLDSRVVVGREPLVWLTTAVAGMLVFFFLYAVFSPKSAVASVRRLFNPRAEILPPTATVLTGITPGDIYVVNGERPHLSVRVTGRRPQSAWAVWERARAETRRIFLAEDSTGVWEGRFPAILDDGTYYIAAGDTRSERYSIKALPRPVVVGVRLSLGPPVYTGLPARTVEGGDAEMVSGTRVVLRATTNLPTQGGLVQFDSDRRRVRLLPVEGEDELESDEFVVQRSDRYSIHFETVTYPGGVSFTNRDPVRFSLTTIEDRSPEVQLLAPPHGVRRGALDRVRLVYSASDDFGVEKVRLKYALDGVFTPQLPVAEPRAPQVEKAEYEWDLAGVPTRPGAVVIYYLEAEDNRAGVPQVGRSEQRHIVIVGSEPGTGPQEEQRQEGGAAEKLPEAVSASGAPSPEGESTGTEDGEAETLRGPEQHERGAGPEAPEDRQAPERDWAAPVADYVREIYEVMDQEPSRPQAPEDQQPSAAGRGSPDGTPAREVQSGGEPEAAAEAGPSQTETLPDQGAGGEGRSAQEAGGEGAETPSGALSPQPGPSSGEGDEVDGAAGAQPDAAARPEGPVLPAAGEGPTGSGEGDEVDGAAGAQPDAAARPERPALPGAGEGPTGSGEGDEVDGAAGAQPDAAARPERPALPGAGEGPTGSGEGAQGAGAGDGEQAGPAEHGTAPAAGGVAGRSSDGEGAADAGSGAYPGAAAGGGGAGGGRLPGPAGPGDTPDLRELDGAVERLAALLENDRVPPRVFEELGTNREKLLRFIEDYRRQRRRSGQKADGAPAGLTIPSGRIIEGAARAARDMMIEDSGAKTVDKDALRARFEGAADELSSRYRDTVDRYYKVLSEEQ